MILLIGLAVGVDYSLFYLRREREERAAGRSEARRARGRRRHLGPRRADLRRDGDRRDGRHVHQRRQDVHLVRRGHDPRRRDRGVRLADGAARDAQSWLGDRVEKGRVPLLGRGAGRPGESRFWSALTGRVMRRPGVVDRARRRAAGRAGDPGAADEERHQRRRPAAAGPAGDRDLQQGQGGLPDGGRHGDRRRRGRRRALRRRRPPASPRCATRSTAPTRFLPGTEVIYSKDGTVAQINVPTRGSGTDAASVRRAQRAARRHRPGDGGRGRRARRVNVTGDAASVGGLRQSARTAGCR